MPDAMPVDAQVAARPTVWAELCLALVASSVHADILPALLRVMDLSISSWSGHYFTVAEEANALSVHVIRVNVNIAKVENQEFYCSLISKLGRAPLPSSSNQYHLVPSSKTWLLLHWAPLFFQRAWSTAATRSTTARSARKRRSAACAAALTLRRMNMLSWIALSSSLCGRPCSIASQRCGDCRPSQTDCVCSPARTAAASRICVELYCATHLADATVLTNQVGGDQRNQPIMFICRTWAGGSQVRSTPLERKRRRVEGGHPRTTL